MAEAARLSPRTRRARHLPLFAFSKMRLATVVASLLIVVGLLPGLTYAVATSTDGSPFYGLKLLGQEARLWLTNNPEAVVDLQVSMAEEQIEGIATAIEEGQSIDRPAVERAEKHLLRAVEAVSDDDDVSESSPRGRLMNTIQSTHRVMLHLFGAGSDPQFEPIHQLMRSMERAREQLNVAGGQAQGEEERSRAGAPADDQQFGEHGPQPAAEGTPGANGPSASQPGPASDPSGKPADAPGPAQGSPSGPAAESTPEPGQSGANGGSQGQSQAGSEDNSPDDHRQPAQKGNKGHSANP